MPDWELSDYRLPVEPEGDAPTTDVTSAQQLRQLLEATRGDFPGLFILKGPGDELLRIVLGGGIGHLFWHDRRTDAVAYAKNESAADADGVAAFIAEGVSDEVPVDRVLPFDTVVDAAIHYYQEQELSPRLTWKIWNPKAKSWSEAPPASA